MPATVKTEFSEAHVYIYTRWHLREGWREGWREGGRKAGKKGGRDRRSKRAPRHKEGREGVCV